MQGATVKPRISPSIFPTLKRLEFGIPQQSNTSRRRTETPRPISAPSIQKGDVYDDGIDDEELVKASCGDLEFQHIENFANPADAITKKSTTKNRVRKENTQRNVTGTGFDEGDGAELIQLSNGKWPCSHKCKDKSACKHLCCKEGMDKPSRKTLVLMSKSIEGAPVQVSQISQIHRPHAQQTKLNLSLSKRKVSHPIEELDLTHQEKRSKIDFASNGPKDYRELNELHKAVQKSDPPSALHSVMYKKPEYCYSQGGNHTLFFMQDADPTAMSGSSDYGGEELDSHFGFPPQGVTAEGMTNLDLQLCLEDNINDVDEVSLTSRSSDTFGGSSVLDDAIVGLIDSQYPPKAVKSGGAGSQTQGGVVKSKDNIAPQHVGPETANTVDNTPKISPCLQNQEMNRGSANSPAEKRRESSLEDTSIRWAKKVSSEVHVPKETEQLRLGLSASIGDPCNEKEPELTDALNMFDDSDLDEAEKPVPEAFKDLESWMFKEFGDIVELVDE